MTLLAVEGLHAYYGDAHILQGVSLTVGAGEVVTLIGRNGAGKTTTLRSIMGLVPPRAGTITFDGRELTKLHEEVVRGTASELAQRYASQPPRGEVVLVVGPATPGPVVAGPLTTGPGGGFSPCETGTTSALANQAVVTNK